ncbi:MAG: 2-C-methyl-D-erythritol 2,4-cyclodiphosphate synthase [Pseudomonadota bacterium]|nr:2-C-methyl-D-erythritol 2,4-cyclodiphosphate synthase [Pseudomonadota bacterium]
MKIGCGYDVHKFAKGDHIILGGVHIPHAFGLAAHSDGDVLIHAICDAMLGALALGDIGRHFPDTDSSFRGADSRDLLRRVKTLVTRTGYRLGNLDSIIVAQSPMMSPHIETMRLNIASDLSCGRDRVSVKATTTERLGFEGREEGIAVHAVCLLESIPSED